MRRAAIVASTVVLAATAALVLTPVDAGARWGGIRARAACGPSSFTRAVLPAFGAGTGELYGVDAISDTAAWAVGGRYDPGVQATVPYALRWNGSAWTEASVPLPPTSQGTSLLAVSGSSPTDVWAVGTKMIPNNLSRTFATHWDGTAWTIVPTPNAGSPRTGVLSGVVAVAADDAWAVGSTSGQGGPERTLVLHWDGSEWSVIPSPNKGPWPNGLADVSAVSPDDLWAVGSWRTKAFVSRSLAIHWDGSAWHRVPSPSPGTKDVVLSGISAVASDDVWTVGIRGLRGLAERWDGSAWTVVPVPNPSANAGLSDVAAVSGTDAWAVGSWVDLGQRRVATQVQRWNGSGWGLTPTQHVGTSDNGLAAVDAVPTRQWTVGYRFAPGGLRILPLVLERCA